MKTKIAFIVAALFVLGACSNDPQPTVTPVTASGTKQTTTTTISNEDVYLSLIEDRDTEGLTVGWSDAELVEVGYLACDILDEYAPDYETAIQDMAIMMMSEPGFSERDAETVGFIMGAAARGLCPEHLDGLMDAANSTY